MSEGSAAGQQTAASANDPSDDFWATLLDSGLRRSLVQRGTVLAQELDDADEAIRQWTHKRNEANAATPDDANAPKENSAQELADKVSLPP